MDGKRIIRDKGYASYKCTYDGRNDLLRVDYYDVNLKPCNIDKGYSRVLYEYSNNYNTRTCKYYDVKGKLIKLEKKKSIFYATDF